MNKDLSPINQGTLYRQLPKLLGANAFVVLSLLQAAKLENLGPVNVRWIQSNSPNFSLWELKAALDKLSSPEFALAVHVEGGWVLNSGVVLKAAPGEQP